MYKIKVGGMCVGVVLRLGILIEEVFFLVCEVIKSIMLIILKVVCFVCKFIVWEIF